MLQFLARRGDPSKSQRFLDGWVQFDGPEYLAIATDGYSRRQIVWFPAYPAALRALERVVGDPVLAGVLVSAVAGLVATVLFWRWTERVGMDPVGRWFALAALLLYPYGWFLYGVVYSDALFLAAAVAGFLAVERDHLWIAAIAGALATATRPSGFAVAIGLVVLTLERHQVLVVPGPGAGWIHRLRIPVRVRPGAMRARLAIPLLSISGLLAYMAYLAATWGDPIGFVTEQGRYHDSGPGTLVKQQFFEAFSGGYDLRHLATTTAQALLVVAVLASVPAVGRRFGWGYATYTLGLALLPAVSVSTFMGAGRYLLPAFPCWALLGGWLSRRPPVVAALWYVTCGVALAVMVFGFSRSWYLT